MKGKAKVVASISRLACEQGTHLVDPKGQARELLKRKDLHLAADNCLCFCLYFSLVPHAQFTWLPESLDVR